MIAKIISAIPQGYRAQLIEVEGDTNRGLPSFNIVGMANKTIEESKERVKSALINSSFRFPNQKVTINLAPADLHKDGSYLDLPIALAVMVLSGQLLASSLTDALFVGELSLAGELRPVHGIINITEAALENGISKIFVPYQNLAQATLVKGIGIIGVKSLQELFLYLKGELTPSTPSFVVRNTKSDSTNVFLDHIKGQAAAKRALVVAIAGRHNILLTGPPGTGKTMLARAAANLLPALSDDEKISVTKIHSLVGSIDSALESRPFRNPHHSASASAIIGGGPHAHPGEISLAHFGILFLDELPEYPKNIIESLRQPLEDRQITISRAKQKASYPANFLLIATSNPCPCGYLGSTIKTCVCTPAQSLAYHKKLSGPILDRIDIVFPVSKIETATLLSSVSHQNTEHEKAQKQIKSTLITQRSRFKSSTKYNSDATSQDISTKFQLNKASKQLLDVATEKLQLSARAYFKTIKVSRTIADIDNSTEILPAHLSEALQYRHK